MTEIEYGEMRNAIKGVKSVFNNDIEPFINIPSVSEQKGGNRFFRTLKYPVQLYKVAAVIAICGRLYCTSKIKTKRINPVLASTILLLYIGLIRSIHIYDTGEIAKNNVHFSQDKLKQTESKNF